jgi:hypothetical protein
MSGKYRLLFQCRIDDTRTIGSYNNYALTISFRDKFDFVNLRYTLSNHNIVLIPASIASRTPALAAQAGTNMIEVLAPRWLTASIIVS